MRADVDRGCASTVAAVVVTHNPDGGLLRRLEAVGRQVHHVIIIENGSAKRAAGGVPVPIALPMTVLENATNQGIGKALNQGVASAMERGYEWVLLLDQDADVDTDLVANLLEIAREHPLRQIIGIVGANVRSRFSGTPLVRVKEGLRYVDVTTTITSGSMLSAKAYSECGPFREDFFIEAVDLEYCLRLRRRGYKIILSAAPLMTHAAGKGQEKRLCGKSVVIPNHPPWRHYYQARNIMITWRQYSCSEPAWMFRSGRNMVKQIAKTILYESQRIEKLKLVMLGFVDGMTGRIRTVKGFS